MTEPLTPEARLAALLHVEIRDKGWASCVHSPEGEWLPFCAEIAARLIAAGVTLDAARQPAAEAALREVPPWDDAAKSWSSRLPVLLAGLAKRASPTPATCTRLTRGPAHAALREMARLADAALAATPTPDPSAVAAPCGDCGPYAPCPKHDGDTVDPAAVAAWLSEDDRLAEAMVGVWEGGPDRDQPVDVWLYGWAAAIIHALREQGAVRSNLCRPLKTEDPR